jgi:PhnB protein
MSQQRLGPYINFQGRAREAMEFYQKVLGGKLDVQTANDRVGQARLEADGVLIVGSDGHPKYPPTVGDHMAIALSGTDKGGLSKIFNDLAAGGQINGPLTAQAGGPEVGWLVDKFGINWMVSIDKSSSWNGSHSKYRLGVA